MHDERYFVAARALSEAPLAALVTIHVRGASSEAAMEFEKLGCRCDSTYPLEWTSLVTAELESRLLSSSSTNQEFQLAIVALITSAEAGALLAFMPGRRAHVAKTSFCLLCQCSHMLPQMTTLSLEDVLMRRLSVVSRAKHQVEFEEDTFAASVLLYKKNPYTLEMNHQCYFVDCAAACWIRVRTPVHELERIVDCMLKTRFCMSRQSRQRFVARLREVRTESNSDIIDRALRKLSKGSMTWRLVWPRILAFVQIHRAWERAAERMARPGGEEYFSAMKRFNEAASAYGLE